MQKRKKQPKRPTVNEVAFTTENHSNGLLYCLSLVIQHERRSPYFKSFDEQDTLDEYVAACKKYRLLLNYRTVQQIQKPNKH
jgi:hypothetical protein